MRRVLVTASICFAIVLNAPSHAQLKSSGETTYRANDDKVTPVPCSTLPIGAVRDIPPPFDRYMRFQCEAHLGQELMPIDGFSWTNSDGLNLGLSAAKYMGPTASGKVHFAYGYYSQMKSVSLDTTGLKTIRKNFTKAFSGAFLRLATIFELSAVTSNKEIKLIFLIIPPAQSKWRNNLVILECNGACFVEDAQPLILFGLKQG